MIEVKNLTKRFDGFTALNGLTMTVPTGSVYGLVGPNGAGKSTIIRHITGVYRPDSGEVLIGGEPVFENPPVKARIACIPDDLSCHAGTTIRELKTFYKGLYPAFSDERFTALADIFKLDQRQPLRRFSKGMRVLARHLHAAGLSRARRAGRRTRPRDAQAGLERHFGGRGRAGNDGSRVVSQSAGIRGRVRPCRRAA